MKELYLGISTGDLECEGRVKCVTAVGTTAPSPFTCSCRCWAVTEPIPGLLRRDTEAEMGRAGELGTDGITEAGKDLRGHRVQPSANTTNPPYPASPSVTSGRLWNTSRARDSPTFLGRLSQCRLARSVCLCLCVMG